MGINYVNNHLHFEHNKRICIEQRAWKDKDSGCSNSRTNIFDIDIQEFEECKNDLMKKMTFEPDSDIEHMPHTDYPNGSNIIDQSINEGLFIAQKDNIKDTNQQTHFSSPTSFNSSEVEYTLTFDCLFNLFSSDHNG